MTIDLHNYKTPQDWDKHLHFRSFAKSVKDFLTTILSDLKHDCLMSDFWSREISRDP